MIHQIVKKEDVRKSKGLPPLYHITFQKVGQRVWKPLLPAGTELIPESSQELGEPPIPRLSVSPTLEQCFRAVWPNVDKYFTKNKYPHLDFYVYQPIFNGEESVVTSETLTQNRWVWDAHVTGEHWILSPVKMRLLGKCRVLNTLDSGLLLVRVFDDPKEKLDSDVGPKKLIVKWLTTMSVESLPISAGW